MNWLNGYTLIWHLAWFGVWTFDMNVKGQGNPSSQGAGKPSYNCQWMAIKLKFNGIFVLYHLPLITTIISDQLRERKSGLWTVIVT